MTMSLESMRAQRQLRAPGRPRLVWKYAHHSPSGGSFSAQHPLTHIQVVWRGAPQGLALRAESEGEWTTWIRLPGIARAAEARGEDHYVGVIAVPRSLRYELRVPRGMSVVRIVEWCFAFGPAGPSDPQTIKGFRFTEGQSIRSDFVPRCQWMDLPPAPEGAAHSFEQPHVIALQHLCAGDLLEYSHGYEDNPWLTMTALAHGFGAVDGHADLPWHYVVDTQGRIWQGKDPGPCGVADRVPPPCDGVVRIGVLGGETTEPLAEERARRVVTWLVALVAGTCGIPVGPNIGTASRWLSVADDPALCAQLPSLRRQVRDLLC
ncbi:hypothetical protein ACIBUY_27545 [Streptomyces sp. NPDC050085]|uniref:hypothetical protein n=1 Tax=Streptomyces sp. NPDC050085 TaxID=3365600 RepID=UPI0037BAC6F9